MKLSVVWLMIAVLFLSGTATAGIAYSDPDRGWAYIFQGDASGTPDATALDGTWNHNNGSDMWDLSGLGAGMPGGVSIINESDATFFRIQDCGDPRDYGMADPSNRKIYFTHDLTQELDTTTAAGILTNGVTLSFRARLSTGGLLDPRYPNSGSTPEPWPSGGDGGFIHDAGKGFFGIRQSTNDWLISFSLALKSDHANVPADGLVMNRQLASGTGRGDVDTSDSPSNSKVPCLALDPTQWHEFWITIAPDTTVAGATHRVTIWLDGALDAAGTFLVTAGDGDEGSAVNYIALGLGATDPSGAFDTDFFAYTPGVKEPNPAPTFNPAPSVAAAPKIVKTHVGDSVQLDGTVSDQSPLEGDPGHLTWYWKKEVGPGTVQFTPGSVDVEDPMATFSAKGIYSLLLQATDGTKDANDVITVYVADRTDEKLVGYWDMEQNVVDQSANSNDGELRGDAQYTSDSAIGNSALDLITESQTDPNTFGFVYLGPAPELDFGYFNEFSVTAWVKTTSTQQSNVFSKGGDEDGGIRYIMSVGETGSPNGRAEMILDDNVNKVVATGTKLVNDGKWHFIVTVVDFVFSRAYVYVDGLLTGSAGLPTNYNLSGTSQTGAYIGAGILSPTDPDRADPNSPYDVYKAGVPQKDLDGLVDDVRVYNYALPLEDPGFTSVRSLAAMGPIPATVSAGPDGTFQFRPEIEFPLQGSVTDYGKPDGKIILWTT
ncbi:MAG: LamG domain-containing protein, partial [Phycisphaerae bacterium]|nr:LamG domain-containing protein [Phycisphaerae bacterium]